MDGMVTFVVLAVPMTTVVASVALVVIATNVNDASRITAKIAWWDWMSAFRLKLPRGLVSGRIVVGINVFAIGSMNLVLTVGVSVVIAVVVARVPVTMIGFRR